MDVDFFRDSVQYPDNAEFGCQSIKGESTCRPIHYPVNLASISRNGNSSSYVGRNLSTKILTVLASLDRIYPIAN